MSNLLIRALSGAVFVILVIGAILLHPFVFAVLFFVVAMLGLHEYLRITDRDESRKSGLLPYLAGGYLYLSIAAFAHFQALNFPYLLAVVLLNLVLPVIMLVAGLYSAHEKPFTGAAKAMLGILYVCLPLALLNFFYYLPSNTSADPVLLIALFALIWINDTFAYLSGTVFGRHKLFPSVSPKKTWEGSAGGALFCLVAAHLLYQYFPVIGLVKWMIFAVIVVIFATLGDLAESMLKRAYQLKDSGNIMPGHGGMLDRFDATLGVAPVAFVLLLIFRLL